MPDYKTTDYCALCGESPESGTHMMPGHGHDYVPPCRCPPSYHGVLHHVACFQTGPRNATAAMPPQALVGASRVKVEDRPNMPQFGVLLGILLDERGDTQVVVRLDHYGLYLKALHPSKVVPVTPEEEAAYKP